MSAPPFDPAAHLDRLLIEFSDLRATALELQTPNPDDDEFIRCGIVGFAQHSDCEMWDFGHFEYVRDSRDEVLNGGFTLDWCRFTCLAAGYFLGMWQAKQITNLDLQQTQAVTPGFMWQHSAALGLVE